MFLISFSPRLISNSASFCKCLLYSFTMINSFLQWHISINITSYSGPADEFIFLQTYVAKRACCVIYKVHTTNVQEPFGNYWLGKTTRTSTHTRIFVNATNVPDFRNFRLRSPIVNEQMALWFGCLFVLLSIVKPGD